jgi:astacin
MRGGEQTITLNKQCDLGAVIHEIGHTAGLFHEQSRHDRDSYVTIMWDQIIEEYKGNFAIPDASISKDIIAYDYDSIMHYGAYAFAKGSLPTIVPNESGVTIGQRSGLSKDDIAAIALMYGPKTVVARKLEEELMIS